MNEEVLKMIVESPDGLEAFAMWMNLQWAQYIVRSTVGLIGIVAVVIFVRWFILAWMEAEDN